MTKKKTPHLDTVCIHGGQKAEPETGACAVPIYQTASYVFPDCQHAADLFSLEKEGHIYSRLSNPTAQVVEKRIAQLEGGSGALLLASGMAAETITFTTLAQQGDNFIASASLYGGSVSLLKNTLPRFGITTKFVPVNNLEAFADAIDQKTKGIYVETIGNPGNDVPDLEKLAQLAHQNNIPLIVDNTFASPFLCRPFEWGADIIIHSTTKFIGGHGTSLGGVIVESGKFPWDNGRFPQFTEPCSYHHGLVFYEHFGPQAFIAKCRVDGMSRFGPCPSPFNAFLTLQGLETLHLRIPRHNENALTIAQFLQKHPKVNWVNYVGLPTHQDHRKAKKYLCKGFGSIFTFGVQGGKKSGEKLIRSLKLITHLANVGDARTLIIHPASTTHDQLTAQEQKAAGVLPELVRISVGIEHPEDIIEDLKQALNQI